MHYSTSTLTPRGYPLVPCLCDLRVTASVLCELHDRARSLHLATYRCMIETDQALCIIAIDVCEGCITHCSTLVPHNSQPSLSI